jgi:hypothetical protein
MVTFVISLIVTCVLGVALFYVNKMFFEDHAERLKRRLAEARGEAKSKRQRERRKELVKNLIAGAIGGMPPAILSGTLQVALILLGIIGGIYFCSSAIMFVASGFVTAMGSICVIGVVHLCLAVVWMLSCFSASQKWAKSDRDTFAIALRIQRVIDAIRDLATKDELRKLAVARIGIYDERTLVTFVLILYDIAKKYGLHAYVAPLIIWPESFVEEFRDLPESALMLNPEVGDEDSH